MDTRDRTVRGRMSQFLSPSFLWLVVGLAGPMWHYLISCCWGLSPHTVLLRPFIYIIWRNIYARDCCPSAPFLIGGGKGAHTYEGGGMQEWVNECITDDSREHSSSRTCWKSQNVQKVPKINYIAETGHQKKKKMNLNDLIICYILLLLLQKKERF